MLAAWLDEQVDRIDAAEFAKRFSENIELPSVSESDFNHRLIKFNGHYVLAGIRFYRLEVANPFVEVIAHDFEDWASLKACVVDEWASFGPLNLRLLVDPAARVIPDAVVDMTIFAARYGDMTPADERVSLARFASPERALQIVEDRYAQLGIDNPKLARRLSRAEADEITDWHSRDVVKAIRAKIDGRPETVGLIAVEAGCIEWVEGDVVNEEVVLDRFAGQGFAASAQCVWAGQQDINPERLLLGTIDVMNPASRRTATRAGRAPAMEYLFLPLRASVA